MHCLVAATIKASFDSTPTPVKSDSFKIVFAYLFVFSLKILMDATFAAINCALPVRVMVLTVPLPTPMSRVKAFIALLREPCGALALAGFVPLPTIWGAGSSEADRKA